jgi:hypothetical protein
VSPLKPSDLYPSLSFLFNIDPSKQEDYQKFMERTFSFANAADGIEITHDTLFSSIRSAIPLQRVFITSNINRVKDGEISSKISKRILLSK